MEFLFLPRSLRDYPGRGISLRYMPKRSKKAKRAKRHPCQSFTTGYRNYTPVGVLLASLALFGHCVGGHTPNTHPIHTQYSPNTHLILT